MQLKDILLTLGTELTKLLVAGIVGGFIGSWISLKTFRSQKKIETEYQDNIRRREALRDLFVILDVVFADIHRDWEMPEGATETSEEHIARLVEQVNRWRTLFLHDLEVSDALHKLYLLIGADFQTFLKPEEPGVHGPGKTIAEIRQVVQNKIQGIEKSLY